MFRFKQLVLYTLHFWLFASACDAQNNVDISYFEKTYGVKFKVQKKIVDYADPDLFFSYIASELKIEKIAFSQVIKREKWAEKSIYALVRRVNNKWRIMVFKKLGKGKGIDIRYVDVEDDKTISYYGKTYPKATEPKKER